MPRKDREAYNAYMREYMLRRYHQRRERILAELGRKCARCGSEEDIEIDHVDRSKKGFSIGIRLSGVSAKKLVSEISKCQLLCRPCHQNKSIKDLGLKVAKGNHGTISSYRYCKCEKCRAAVRKYRRKLRERKKLEKA